MEPCSHCAPLAAEAEADRKARGYAYLLDHRWQCKGCGGAMHHHSWHGQGPAPDYCCGACKQRAYRARKRDNANKETTQ